MPGRVGEGDLDDLLEVRGSLEKRRRILRSGGPRPQESLRSRVSREAIPGFIAALESDGAKIQPSESSAAGSPNVRGVVVFTVATVSSRTCGAFL